MYRGSSLGSCPTITAARNVCGERSIRIFESPKSIRFMPTRVRDLNESFTKSWTTVSMPEKNFSAVLLRDLELVCSGDPSVGWDGEGCFYGVCGVGSDLVSLRVGNFG